MKFALAISALSGAAAFAPTPTVKDAKVVLKASQFAESLGAVAPTGKRVFCFSTACLNLDPILQLFLC